MKWKTIVIIALSLIVVQTSYAKGKTKKVTISGYVVDGNSNPLEGVSIIVDGKTLNKKTNQKGFYKIKVKLPIETLMVYSFTNGGLEVEYTGRRNIDFILSPETTGSVSNIPDELVDVGYGSVKKSENTYSTSTIRNEESNPKYKTIYDMIRGQVPGVTVNGTTITVRGVGSYMGSTEPLIVVDGISVQSVEAINPNDVKSISVLKGAATAIYGTRGSNGVLLITTKRGSDIK